MTTISELEEQKAKTLAMVEEWPPEWLSYSPEPGEWSAIQVLDHLVRAESGIVAAMRRGLRDPQEIGEKDRAGFAMVERVFLTERRVKAPDATAGAPPGPDVTLEDLRERW